DDMQTSEKIKVYDRGAGFDGSSGAAHDRRVSYRIGDMWAPAISAKEALVTEIEQFVRAVETGVRPPSDGESGLRVVETRAAAANSTTMRGQPVELGTLRKAS